MKTFLNEVLIGLGKRNKKLNSKWFYDYKGSKLFEQITSLDEYYPTRTEKKILSTYKNEIANEVGSKAIIIEPGAGDTKKIGIFLISLNKPKKYIPLDISEEYIKKNDNWIFEKISSKKHVRGPIKSYKKECFKEIGGLKESIGWDTVDVLLAKYNKWKVVTNENLIVKHLKPTGLNYNKSAKYLQGEALYKMRFGIVLSLLSALKRAYNQRSLTYLIFIKIGYIVSVFSSKKRLVNKKEGNFIRKLIWKNIFKKVIF